MPAGGASARSSRTGCSCTGSESAPCEPRPIGRPNGNGRSTPWPPSPAWDLIWCMATPADLVLAATLDHVVAVRTSDDYRFTADAALLWTWYLTVNRVAGTLGLPAFKDCFFSRRRPAGGDAIDGDEHAELEALLACMSAGPVGIGDRLGRTDPQVVLRTCDDDGRIRHVDRPSASSTSAFSGGPHVGNDWPGRRPPRPEAARSGPTSSPSTRQPTAKSSPTHSRSPTSDSSAQFRSTTGVAARFDGALDRRRASTAGLGAVGLRATRRTRRRRRSTQIRDRRVRTRLSPQSIHDRCTRSTRSGSSVGVRDMARNGPIRSCQTPERAPSRRTAPPSIAHRSKGPVCNGHEGAAADA